jgi:hypothetical protein
MVTKRYKSLCFLTWLYDIFLCSDETLRYCLVFWWRDITLPCVLVTRYIVLCSGHMTLPSVLVTRHLRRPHTNCVKTSIKTWDKKDKSWRQHHDSDRCEAVSTVLLSLRHVADIVSWLLHALTHAGERPTLKHCLVLWWQDIQSTALCSGDKTMCPGNDVHNIIVCSVNT